MASCPGTAESGLGRGAQQDGGRRPGIVENGEEGCRGAVEGVGEFLVMRWMPCALAASVTADPAARASMTQCWDRGEGT